MFGTLLATLLGSEEGFWGLFVCALSLAIVGVAWNDAEGGSDGSKHETLKDRLDSICRAFADLIASVEARRRQGNEGEFEKDDSKSVDPERSTKKSSLSGSDSFFDGIMYGADYDDQLFASKENADEKSDDGESWKEERSDDKTEPVDDGHSSANYAGAFFRSRNYPRDVYDSENPDAGRKRPRDEQPRWRRSQDSDKGDSAFVDSPADEVPDDENEDASRYLSDDYLDDASIPLRQKIETLRKAVEDGREEAVLPFVDLLLDFVGSAEEYQESEALAALDEARDALVDDDGRFPFDEERALALARVYFQRIIFYLQNDLKPPIAVVNETLDQIREWSESQPSSESTVILARAHLLHGRALYSLGADAPALSSYDKALALLDDYTDVADPEDLDVLLGLIWSSKGEAYRSVGDDGKTIESYFKAFEIYDRYSERETLLAERAHAAFNLALAYQDAGDEAETERYLQNAIEAEERLFSFDNEKYFLALAQLLQFKSDLLVSRDEYVEGSATLERAISTIHNYLSYEGSFRARFDAYSQLIDAYRRRAALRMFQGRDELAADDVREATNYAVVAATKYSDFEPYRAATTLFTVAFELAVRNGEFRFAVKLRDYLDQLIRPFECPDPDLNEPLARVVFKKIVPIYVGTLFRCNILFAKEGLLPEAIAATERAVEALDHVVDAEEDWTIQRARVKALFQRALFYLMVEPFDVPRAKADFERMDKIFGAMAREGELDEESAQLYVSTLAKRAGVCASEGDLQSAREHIVLGVNVVVEQTRLKNWDFVSELGSFAQLAVLWTMKSQTTNDALRVVRLFLMFLRRLRRRFVDADWEPSATDGDSEKSLEFLSELETQTIICRALRVFILEASPRRRAEELNYSPSEQTVAAALRLDRRGARFNENGRDNGTSFLLRDVPGVESLDVMREKFARRLAESDPRDFISWVDLNLAARAFERRIERRDFNGVMNYVAVLYKIVEIYKRGGDAKTALVEACDVAKRFEPVLAEIAPDLKGMLNLPNDVDLESLDSLVEKVATQIGAPTASDRDESETARDVLPAAAFAWTLVAKELAETANYNFGDDCDETAPNLFFEILDVHNDEFVRKGFLDDLKFRKLESDCEEFLNSGADETAAARDDVDPFSRNVVVVSRRSDPSVRRRVDFAFALALGASRGARELSPQAAFVFANTFALFARWMNYTDRKKTLNATIRSVVENVEPTGDAAVYAAASRFFFCDRLAEVFYEDIKDSKTAALLLKEAVKIVESGALVVSDDGDDVVPSARVAFVYWRLAKMASEGKAPREDECAYLFKSAPYFMKELEKNSFDLDVFRQTVKILVAALSDRKISDRKTAVKLALRAHRLFSEGLEKDELRFLVSDDMWELYSLLAKYYSVERFYYARAKFFFEKANELKDQVWNVAISGEVDGEFLYRIFTVDGWGGSFLDANGCYSKACDATRARLEQVEKLFAEKNKRNIDETTFYEMKSIYALLGVRYVDMLRLAGRFDQIARCGDKYLAAMREARELFFVVAANKKARGSARLRFVDDLRRLWRRGKKNRTFEKRIDEHLEWASLYYIAEALTELAKIGGKNYPKAKRFFDRFHAEILPLMNEPSFDPVGFEWRWADFAFHNGRLDEAIKRYELSKEIFEKSSESKKAEDEERAAWEETAKISLYTSLSDCYLSRKRVGDVERAERLVDESDRIFKSMLERKLYCRRFVYTDALIVKAKLLKEKNLLDEAKSVAKRARASVKRCEARGCEALSPELLLWLDAFLGENP